MKMLPAAVLASLCLLSPVRASDGPGHAHDDPAHGQGAKTAPKAKPAPPRSAPKTAVPATRPAPARAEDQGEADVFEEHEASQSAPDAPSGGGAHGEKSAPQMRILIKGALQRLKEGNRRFAEGKPSAPRRHKDQRTLVAKAQLPFAIIVGCADSRVPPEIVFDQGLGDLFVVRVAGNVIDDPALGSIEYAVEHLGSRLIVVLGHERCGAVDAACKGGDPGAHVGSLVQAIRPAVEAARRRKGDNLLADAVKANVERVVDQLKGAWPVLGPEIREEKISVVGGVYDLETGVVEFIP